MNTVYYKNINLLYDDCPTYDKLSIEVKQIARRGVLDVQKIAYYKAKQAYLSTDINTKINKPNKYKSLIKDLKVIKRLESDCTLLEKFILENVCKFTNEGLYITYSFDYAGYFNTIQNNKNIL